MFKISYKSIILAMVLGIPCTAKPAWESLSGLEKRGSVFSGIVVDLETGKVVAEHNANRKLTPASVTKLLIAAAMLEKYGSDYTFPTKMFATGKKENGVLHGDLVLQGAGDPSLTNEMLWFLCTDVARSGIREVRGNLVLNTSYFDDIIPDSNRASGKKFSTHAYDSPLSAAAVNFSVAAAVVSPGQAVGKPASVALEPYALRNIELESSVITVASGKKGKIQVSRERKNNKDKIKVTGSISIDDFPMRVYRSISDATEYSGNVILAFLEHAGVTVKGKIIIDKNAVSPNTQPVAMVNGYPLDWQLRGLFKVSNNFIADMLTIDYAATSAKKVTLDDGASLLLEYLKQTIQDSRWQIKDQTKDIILKSGSGLTPENKLSSLDIVAVLDRMYLNTREFPAFYSALPIPGSEGTVKKRFNEKEELPFRAAIRAKTGTLTEPVDVSSLAGYVRSKTGKWLAFSIIVNGTGSENRSGVGNYREAMDADLIEILTKGL